MLNLMEEDKFTIENLRMTQYDSLCAVTSIQEEIERYWEKNVVNNQRFSSFQILISGLHPINRRKPLRAHRMK